MYFATNASIPFHQWSQRIVRQYPFIILSPLVVSDHLPLFIRVASVNSKGSTLSDFHQIHRHRTAENHERFFSHIEQFRCLTDDQDEIVTLQWTLTSPLETHLHLNGFVLYYLEIIETNNEIFQLLTLPMNSIVSLRQESIDLFQYVLNRTSLNLQSHHQALVRFHLAVRDQDDNQHSLTTDGIFCLLPRRFGELSY